MVPLTFFPHALEGKKAHVILDSLQLINKKSCVAQKICRIQNLRVCMGGAKAQVRVATTNILSSCTCGWQLA